MPDLLTTDESREPISACPGRKALRAGGEKRGARATKGDGPLAVSARFPRPLG